MMMKWGGLQRPLSDCAPFNDNHYLLTYLIIRKRFHFAKGMKLQSLSIHSSEKLAVRSYTAQ